MAKIHILPAEVFNRIAAGEVVENPASIMKELVENSIDAGATDIKVTIENGGKTFIQVTDNGCGIEQEYVKFAFLPHATSKVKTVDDLNEIQTLGFRGEALASIASVAEVTMVTKTEDADVATKIELKNGLIDSFTEVGGNKGTTVEVRNLFFNVPARLKFLKKDKSEEANVTDFMERFILANPNIAFKYIVDGKVVYQSLGKDEASALFAVYGKQAVTETISIEKTFGNYALHGVIGKPSFSKSNRTYQTLVVNGRYANNATIAAAVANAYEPFLMKRQYPFYVLYLKVPFDAVDVNIHPRKMEIKFEQNSLIYINVFEAVSKGITSNQHSVAEADGFIVENKVNKTIAQTQSAPSFTDVPMSIQMANSVIRNPFATEKVEQKAQTFVPLDENQENKYEEMFFTPTQVVQQVVKMQEDSVAASGVPTASKMIESMNASMYASYEDDGLVHFDCNKPRNVQGSLFQNADAPLKILGRVFETYILVENEQGLYFIDQHAAHERLNYDYLLESMQKKSVEKQYLLVPYTFDCNPLEYDFLLSSLPSLQEMGFEIEEFGTRAFRVVAVPLVLCNMSMEQFFKDLFADLKNLKSITAAEILKEKIMQKACKSSVKAGDYLETEEIQFLLHKLGNDNVVLQCPHGRPVVVKLTKNDIEKWFKRLV